MLPTLTLRKGPEEYQLCCDLADCTGKPAALALLDSNSAFYFLKELITDSGQQHELRLWLLDHNTSFEMYCLDDDSILECAARMIASGQIVIAGSQATGASDTEGDSQGQTEGMIRKGGGQSTLKSQVETTPLQDEMASSDQRAANQAAADESQAADQSQPAGADSQTAQTTWIAIELIDADGNSVANEQYKITMPDGSIKYGTLDANGKARIEKLQPGTCQVTFPNRDQEVWEVG